MRNHSQNKNNTRSKSRTLLSTMYVQARIRRRRPPPLSPPTSKIVNNLKMLIMSADFIDPNAAEKHTHSKEVDSFFQQHIGFSDDDIDDLRKGQGRGGISNKGSTSPSSPKPSSRAVEPPQWDTSGSKPDQELKIGHGNDAYDCESHAVRKQPGDDTTDCTSSVRGTVNEEASQMEGVPRFEAEDPEAENAGRETDCAEHQVCSAHQAGAEKDSHLHGRETSSSEVEEFDDANESLNEPSPHEGALERRPSREKGLKDSESEPERLDTLSAESPQDAAAGVPSPEQVSTASSLPENESGSHPTGHDVLERLKQNVPERDSEDRNPASQETVPDTTGAPADVELKPGFAATASEDGSTSSQTAPREAVAENRPDPADQPENGEKSVKVKKPEEKKKEGKSEGQTKGEPESKGKKEDKGSNDSKEKKEKKGEMGGRDGKDEKESGGGKGEKEDQGSKENEGSGENAKGEKGDEERTEGKGVKEDKGEKQGKGEKEGKGEKRDKQQEKQEKVKKRASAGANLGGSASSPEGGSPGGERPESCIIS